MRLRSSSTTRNRLVILGELVPQLRLSGSADVTLQMTGNERPLPDPIAAEIVRVVQEATANALVHARAKQVVVSLVFAPNQITVRVEDDGVGFDPEQALGGDTQHFGLVGLRERAQHLRGTLRLDSTPGQGASIEVTIPT